jgi:hypothetical protein
MLSLLKPLGSSRSNHICASSFPRFLLRVVSQLRRGLPTCLAVVGKGPGGASLDKPEGQGATRSLFPVIQPVAAPLPFRVARRVFH